MMLNAYSDGTAQRPSATERRRQAVEREIARDWARITEDPPVDAACIGCGERQQPPKDGRQCYPFPVFATPYGHRCKDCYRWARLSV